MRVSKTRRDFIFFTHFYIRSGNSDRAAGGDVIWLPSLLRSFENKRTAHVGQAEAVGAWEHFGAHQTMGPQFARCAAVLPRLNGNKSVSGQTHRSCCLCANRTHTLKLQPEVCVVRGLKKQERMFQKSSIKDKEL